MFADVFTLLFVAHFAGDYLFQTDHMAEHKAERSGEGWNANLTHVGCHLAATFAALFVAQLALGLDVSGPAFFGAAAWIGIRSWARQRAGVIGRTGRARSSRNR